MALAESRTETRQVTRSLYAVQEESGTYIPRVCVRLPKHGVGMKQKAVMSRGGCEGGLAGTGGEASPWNLRHSGLGASNVLPILEDELGTPQPVAGGGTALLHSLKARSPQDGVPLENTAACAQPLQGPHPGQTTAASCPPRFCCPPPPGAPTQDPTAVPQPPRSHLAWQHLKLGLSAGGLSTTPPPCPSPPGPVGGA